MLGRLSRPAPCWDWTLGVRANHGLTRCLQQLAANSHGFRSVHHDTQAACSEAEATRRQEALIKEEETREAESGARAAQRAAAERERKARKKARRKVRACPQFRTVLCASLQQTCRAVCRAQSASEECAAHRHCAQAGKSQDTRPIKQSSRFCLRFLVSNTTNLVSQAKLEEERARQEAEEAEATAAEEAAHADAACRRQAKLARHKAALDAQEAEHQAALAIAATRSRSQVRPLGAKTARLTSASSQLCNHDLAR